MRTVGVYKTDVDDRSRAETMLDEIRRNLPGCDPNFDLDDCDKVLRVENVTGQTEEAKIKHILESYGYSMNTLT